MQRVMVMADGKEIAPPDLPTPMRFSAPRPAVELRSLAEVEAEHIRLVLARVDWNKTRAAEALGITTRTIRNKLAEYRNDRA